MKWYAIALVLGMLAPFLTHTVPLMRAFRENGIANGIGLWAGLAVGTSALFLVMAWFGTQGGYLPQ